MNYFIGQIFEKSYPSDVAIWCNRNNAYVQKDGNRYQIVAVPAPTKQEIKDARIAELKAQLDSTDYKIIKCSECQLAGVELPYDVVELHNMRQALRDEINNLQGE